MGFLAMQRAALLICSPQLLGPKHGRMGLREGHGNATHISGEVYAPTVNGDSKNGHETPLAFLILCGSRCAVPNAIPILLFYIFSIPVFFFVFCNSVLFVSISNSPLASMLMESLLEFQGNHREFSLALLEFPISSSDKQAHFLLRTPGCYRTSFAPLARFHPPVTRTAAAMQHRRIPNKRQVFVSHKRNLFESQGHPLESQRCQRILGILAAL